MSELDRIKEIIKKNEAILRGQYHICSLSVFGSVARGEETTGSDIDLLVEFSEPVGFGFFRASRYLEEITGRKVDLVTGDALRPSVAASAEKELIYA